MRFFGRNVELDLTTNTLVVGAPMWSTGDLSPHAGQVFVYDTQVVYVQFSASIFACVENTVDQSVAVTVHRTQTLIDQPLTIAYATEDLTAFSVDVNKYTECMGQPITQRTQCTDYQQTNGLLTFAAGDRAKQIRIPIVDDLCYEPFVKEFVVRLGVPGGEALVGGMYSTCIA